MAGIFALHRYLGELLVIVSLAGLILALIAGGQDKEGVAKLARTVLRVFGGLLSLQWLLGVVSYIAISPRPSLAHPLLMTGVVALFHIFQGRIARGDWSGRWPLVGLYAGAWALIALGIRLI